MDLTKMTRGDLAALQGELRTVASAADVLAEAGQEPEISLTSWETAIRCAPLSCFAQAEPPQLLERDLPSPDFALDAAADPAPAEGGGAMVDSVPFGTSPSPEANADRAPEIQPPFPPGVAAALDGIPCPVQGTETAARTMASGPLTDGEKADIRRRHAEGEDVDAIAAALNRKRPAVQMFLMRAAAAQKATPSPDPAQTPETFRPIDDLAKGLVAGATSSRPAAPADPDEARIYAHLASLSTVKGIDAEADLEIVDAFLGGRPGSQVALDLGLDGKAVKARFDALTAPLRDVLGKLPKGGGPGMTILQRQLRERVALARRG